MENASKALLIAASVLIAIVLIAFAVTTINSTAGTQDSVKQTMDAAEIAMYNNKFSPYLGENKTPAQAKALVNVIISHNALVDNIDEEGVIIQIVSSGPAAYQGSAATTMMNRISKLTRNSTISVGTDGKGIRENGTIRKIYINDGTVVVSE